MHAADFTIWTIGSMLEESDFVWAGRFLTSNKERPAPVQITDPENRGGSVNAPKRERLSV